MPQNDIIVLEYGTSCQFKRTISAELLYRYSRTLPSYCNTAKQLCGKYRVCDEIKEQLASLSSMVTSAKYKEKGVEDEVRSPSELCGRCHVYPTDNPCRSWSFSSAFVITTLSQFIKTVSKWSSRLPPRINSC